MSEPTIWQAWAEGMDHAKERADDYMMKEHGRKATEEEIEEEYAFLCEKFGGY